MPSVQLFLVKLINGKWQSSTYKGSKPPHTSLMTFIYSSKDSGGQVGFGVVPKDTLKQGEGEEQGSNSTSFRSVL